MATYFHGGTSEIQSSAADGFHTLYLLNPSSATTTYVPYSDTSPHPPAPTPNMLLLNPNSPPDALHHHAPPPSTHNLTLPTNLVPLGSHDPSRPSSFLPHDFSGFHGFAAAPPRVHYNLWPSTSIIDHPPPSASAATASTSSGRAASASVVGDASPHMSFRRPSQQGLSLSLSSQQTAYRSLSGELDVNGQPQVGAISGASCGRGGENVRVVVNHGSSNNVMSSVPSLILGSKYLKAAQEVLDEVVNVGKGIQKGELIEGANKEKMKANRDSTSGGNREGSSSGGGENSGKQAPELTTAQRQELQMKKSKLVSMLDEVEQRYRQYHHQMQMVISSFEQAAGYGASKTYTSLALKTISKQFRCLKDAIASQVKATSKSLGEDDCLGAKVEGSRLRYVDHHLRQQRALQQLGMMQHNAWRPQRGLPERAVSILRAWLFEHFLHPYPKDSDKVMLAKQTGLTRSQVSNWFINARVRLWKPMVEEMYMEEMKEQDGNNGSQENSRSRSKEAVGKEVGPTTNNKEESSQQLPQDQSGMKGFQSNINSYIPNQSFNNQRTSPMYLQPDSAASGAGLIHVHHHGMSPKKPRTSTSEIIMHNSPSSILSVETMEMKGGDTGHRERQCKEQGYPPLMMTNNANHDGGYGGFSMQDIGRFNNVADQLPPRFHGNAVSLTLGLPHTDSNIPLSHGFLSHNVNLASDHATTEFCGINTAPPSHSSTTSSNYDNNIDIQNRKRFAAQLLPDFVI